MDLRIPSFPELRQTLLLSCRTVKRRLDRSLVASLPITLVSPGSMYGRAVESARPAPGAPGTSGPHEDDVPVRSVQRAERCLARARGENPIDFRIQALIEPAIELRALGGGRGAPGVGLQLFRRPFHRVVVRLDEVEPLLDLRS